MRISLLSLTFVTFLVIMTLATPTSTWAQDDERRTPTDVSRMTGTVNEIDTSRRITPDIKPLYFTFQGPEIGLTKEYVTSLKNLSLRLRNTNDRVLITSFAGNNTTSTHEAVKLSLTRALIIRNFLENNGVLPDQIDFSALGQTKDNGDKNRVDITPTMPN